MRGRAGLSRAGAVRQKLCSCSPGRTAAAAQRFQGDLLCPGAVREPPAAGRGAFVGQLLVRRPPKDDRSPTSWFSSGTCVAPPLSKWAALFISLVRTCSWSNVALEDLDPDQEPQQEQVLSSGCPVPPARVPNVGSIRISS